MEGKEFEDTLDLNDYYEYTPTLGAGYVIYVRALIFVSGIRLLLVVGLWLTIYLNRGLVNINFLTPFYIFFITALCLYIGFEIAELLIKIRRAKIAVIMEED